MALPRNNVIQLRVSDEEKARIAERGRERGLSISEFLRVLAVEDLAKDDQGLAKLVTQAPFPKQPAPADPSQPTVPEAQESRSTQPGKCPKHPDAGTTKDRWGKKRYCAEPGCTVSLGDV